MKKNKARYFLVSYKYENGYGHVPIKVIDGLFSSVLFMNFMQEKRDLQVVILSVFELTEEEYKLSIK